MTQPSPGSARRIAFTAGGAFAAFYIFYTAAPATLTTGNLGAGELVGIVMLIVVTVQPFVPLLGRWVTDRRRTVTAAVASMGAGSAVLPFAEHWPGMVLLGSGFGVFVVASTAWVKEIAPPSGLGKALGVYGFGSAIGGAVGAPLGLYLAERSGITGIAIAGAAVAFTAILPTVLTPTTQSGSPTPATPKAETASPTATPARDARVIAGASLLAQLAAVTIYATVLTDLASMSSTQATWITVSAAFALQACLAAGRWIGGAASNRWPSSQVALCALLVAVLGAVGFATSANTLLITTFVLIVGLTSGACQTAALASLMNRTRSSADTSRASAAWNMSFDIGLGLGALAAGTVGHA